MNANQIALRAERLLESGNPSAKSCAQDALVASSNAQTGVPFPVSNEGQDAELWAKAAERWIERGASHAWGFSRPDGW